MPVTPRHYRTRLNQRRGYPINFGCKMSWLAIKTSRGETVLKLLAIQIVQPPNWRTTFVVAYNVLAAAILPFGLGQQPPGLCTAV